MNASEIERHRELEKKYAELMARVRKVEEQLKKLRTNQYEQRSHNVS